MLEPSVERSAVPVPGMGSARLSRPWLPGSILALLVACGEVEEGGGGGSSTGSTSAAGGGLGTVFLLDRLGRARVSSPLLDARGLPPLAAEGDLMSLPSTGSRFHALPLAGLEGTSSTPAATLLDAEGRAVATAETSTDLLAVPRGGELSALHAGGLALRVHRAHREFRLVEHWRFAAGFPRPRTPEGEAGVLLTRDTAASWELIRTGIETRVELQARFLAQWKAELIPTIVFLLDGEEVGRFAFKDNQEPVEMTLPAAEGRQVFTLAAEGVPESLDGNEHKLVVERLHFDEVDGKDKVEVLGAGDREGWTLRYPLADPPGVSELRPSPGASEIDGVYALLEGRASLVVAAPASFSVALDGEVVASSTEPVRELAFDVKKPGAVRVTVSGARGVAQLVQPNATLRADLEHCRREESPDAHPLVRHVIVGDDSRRSLLLPPPSTIEVPMPDEAVTEFLGSFSARPLQKGAAGGPLGRPVVRVTWSDGETERELGRARPEGLGWQPLRWKIPEEVRGRGTLVIRTELPPDAPLLSQTTLFALAEPKLRYPPERRPPNVLIYLIDTLRADHLHCYGYHRETSPNIDALAAEGILFRKAYSQAPWTRPSIASLFTGLIYSFHGAGKQTGLVPELVTMAETFHEYGYDTAAFSANAQIHGRGLNFSQGFQRFLGLEDEVGNTRADGVNRRALPWLQRASERPFFAFVHTIDPHAKYDPPPATRGKFSSAQYRGSLNPRVTGSRMLDQRAPLSPEDAQYVFDLYDEEILFNDLEFGRLVDVLKRAGVYEDTVIVVISDHGEEFYEHEQYGHGGRLWQELLHVPLVIKLAEGGPEGLEIDADVRLVDLYPTLASYLGMDVGIPMHGHDLVPLWGGEPIGPLDVIAEEEPQLRSFQRGSMKVIEVEDRRTKERVVQLYDLGADPGESADLGSVRSAEARELIGHLSGVILKYREVMEPVGDGMAVELTAEEVYALLQMGYVEVDEFLLRCRKLGEDPFRFDLSEWGVDGPEDAPGAEAEGGDTGGDEESSGDPGDP